MTKPIDWESVRMHRAETLHRGAQPVICKCGETFTPTPAGRLEHRRMNGHTAAVGSVTNHPVTCDNGHVSEGPRIAPEAPLATKAFEEPK